MKSEHEIEFEQHCLTFEKQLELADKHRHRLTEDKLRDFSLKLKKIANVLQRIQSNLKTSLRTHKNSDQYDVKDKLRRYKARYEKLYDRSRTLDASYYKMAKQELMNNKSQGIEMDELTLNQRNRDLLLEIDKNATETDGIMRNNYENLVEHDKIYQRIQNENREFEHELSITDQLMRVLTNRNLITKLILVLLVFFLGLSDLIILFLKII